MGFLKELKWSAVVSSIMCIAIGVFLIVNPTTSLELLCTIIGIALIVIGVFNVIRYFIYDIKISYYRNDFIIGILLCIVGALVMWKKELVISLVPIILGVTVVISGFSKMQDGIDARRLGYKQGGIYIILALVNIGIGFLVLMNPFKTANILFIVIGVGLVYSGLSDLYSTLYLSVKLKKFLKASNHSVIDAEVHEHEDSPQPEPTKPEEKVEEAKPEESKPTDTPQE